MKIGDLASTFPSLEIELKNCRMRVSEDYQQQVNIGSMRNLLRHFRSLRDVGAESARAVTGRRCPHSGVGEDFLARRTGPLTKTGVTRKQKVSK